MTYAKLPRTHICGPKFKRVVETYILYRCQVAATARALNVTAPTLVTWLARPEVVAYLEQRMDDLTAAVSARATDVISTLNRHMLADVADLFPDNELLQRAKLNGISRNIKKVKIRKIRASKGHPGGEEIEIEMYSAQQAAGMLGKFFGLDSPSENDRARTAIKMYCEMTGESPERAIEALAPRFPSVVKVKDEFIRPLLSSGDIEGEIVD